MTTVSANVQGRDGVWHEERWVSLRRRQADHHVQGRDLIKISNRDQNQALRVMRQEVGAHITIDLKRGKSGGSQTRATTK